MGLDALQMRGMEQQAKPDRGYVSSTYANGRGEVCRREVVVINGASIPPRRPTFTRNTYPRRFQPGPTLALPPLSTRSYLSPPSPDFDPANTLPPALSSRIENFLPSSLFLISLLVISSRF